MHTEELCANVIARRSDVVIRGTGANPSIPEEWKSCPKRTERLHGSACTTELSTTRMTNRKLISSWGVYSCPSTSMVEVRTHQDDEELDY
jgi:hypothetical protein